MNSTLFLSTSRRTYKIFAFFAALLLFYLLVTISMYASSGGADPFEMLPAGMRNAFEMGEGMQGLTGFIAVGFYGVTFVIFMMILSIMTANQLMASLVDRGSMAYLLSTPVSRSKVAFTQALILIVGLFLLMVLVTIAGLLAVPLMIDHPDFNKTAFIQINLMGFLLFLFISGYSFLSSSLLNDSKQSLAASGFLSIAFYMFNLISNMSENLEWLRYLTVLSFFRPVDIAAGMTQVIPGAIGMGIAGVLMYSIAIYVFKRRDLPL